MPPRAPDATAGRRLVLAATSCAILVLASQLAGKAARDAIFLERFPVSNLPLLLAVSSALAIATTFVFAHRLRRGIPVRVVRLANVASAVLFLVEWALLEVFPRPVATIIFMHQTLLGPILVSGFWSVVSELFDPRLARRVLGTIGTGATIGAVVGAVLAERVAALIGTNELLPAIAALQLAVTWQLSRLGRGRSLPTDDGAPVLREAIHNITRVSLLRRLAVVTVIVTVAAAFLDFLFKSMATEVVRRPDDLARLFATFHGIVGVLTAIVQWLFGRWALQHLGLARTLATLPAGVIGFGLVAVAAPGIGTFVALRGAENVLRNSLYREAYEVFYTPLLAAERRATKTIIDVGVERFGDVVGGVAVLVILALVASPTLPLLAGAIALSVFGMVVALQAQKSYVEALERSLLDRAVEFGVDEPRDRTTRTTLEMLAHRTLAGRPVWSAGAATASAAANGRVGPANECEVPAPPAKPPAKTARWPIFRSRRDAADRGSGDAAWSQLVELTSGDAKRIRRALDKEPLSPGGVAIAITLLGRADVATAATRAIAKVASTCIGQLADALRDPQLPLAVRTQLPPMIVAAADDAGRAELARAGLVACLRDPELAIRAGVAEALAELRDGAAVTVDEHLVFEAVRRELGEPMTAATIAHLAMLLALALPAEPIRTAFHGLNSDDPALRGVALEYLENVLPSDIRDRMWLVLAVEAPTAAQKRPVEDVLAELLRPRRPRDDDPLRTTQVDLPAVWPTRWGTKP